MNAQNLKYKRIFFPAVIGVIAFCVAVSFSSVFTAPVLKDSKQFDELGWNLARGKGFVDGNMQPTMIREPVYPYFLSLIYRLSGHSHKAVTIVQALLFSGVAVLTFFLAKDVFGSNIAKISSLAVAVFPTLADYTVYILSEVFFTFCLLALILVLTKSLKYASYAGIFASGIILAILALTKAVMLLFIVFAIGGFFIYNLGKKKFLKKFLLMSLIFTFAFALLVCPWIARNKRFFGVHSITTRAGKALYNRSVKLDYGWAEWKKILTFSVSEFLGKKVYPDEVSPEKVLLLEDHMAEAKMSRLIDRGLTPQQADSVLIEESIDKIKKRPLRYLGQSALESVKLLGFTHIRSLNEEDALKWFSKFKNGKITLSVTRGIFRMLAYLIMFFCVGGILISLKSWRRWMVMFLAMLYIGAVYSLTFSWARYTVPLLPCYLIFAAVFAERIFFNHEAA